MQWCVCQTKSGELFVQSRPERERMLDVLIELQADIPHFVIKTFDTQKQAEDYVAEMTRINKIINQII